MSWTSRHILSEGSVIISDPVKSSWTLSLRGSWLSVDSGFVHSSYAQPFILTPFSWLFCEFSVNQELSTHGLCAAWSSSILFAFAYFLEQNWLLPTHTARTRHHSNGVCLVIHSLEGLFPRTPSVQPPVHVTNICWTPTGSQTWTEAEGRWKINTLESGKSHALVLKGDIATMKCHKE